MKRNNLRTRFAPSPTGLLHLGHAYSALYGSDWASRTGGAFLIRIEDIDRTRCKPEFETAIHSDLHWLGLNWEEPVLRQSERFDLYFGHLDRLADLGVLYPCSCNRRDIQSALGPDTVTGPDGHVYPGTCRGRPMSEARPEDALRLDMARALDLISHPLSFTDEGEVHPGEHALERKDLIGGVGDVVLRRRIEHQPAYHLAAVIDDGAQHISHVIRGADLFDATRIHVVLQELLGLPRPVYLHHRLILDDNGKRLAKRDDARAIARYRDDGLNPDDVRALVGL